MYIHTHTYNSIIIIVSNIISSRIIHYVFRGRPAWRAGARGTRRFASGHAFRPSVSFGLFKVLRIELYLNSEAIRLNVEETADRKGSETVTKASGHAFRPSSSLY